MKVGPGFAQIGVDFLKQLLPKYLYTLTGVLGSRYKVQGTTLAQIGIDFLKQLLPKYLYTLTGVLGSRYKVQGTTLAYQ